MPESQQLRDEMRRYALEKRGIQFIEWVPDTDVLNLKARYREINDRLKAYVAAHEAQVGGGG